MKTGRESAPFLLDGRGGSPPHRTWRPIVALALAVRRRDGRRGLIVVRHMGASQRGHRGQRQQNRAKESSGHACPLLSDVARPRRSRNRPRSLPRLYRSSGHGASVGDPSRGITRHRFYANRPYRSRYQPRSKGLNRLLRCNSRSGTPVLPARHKTHGLPRPRPLHLPTAPL